VVDPQGQGLFPYFSAQQRMVTPLKNEHENDVIMKQSARAWYPTGGMEAVRFTWNITAPKSVEIFKERHGGHSVRRQKKGEESHKTMPAIGKNDLITAFRITL